jgi:uncharacterized tellurite resistance protein B-like protein
MTPIENLHYAVGELAYAVAKADGDVQKKERLRFQSIVAAELRCENYGFDISSIIFQIMDKENHSVADAYDSAMRQIRLNSHYLSPEMKQTFISVMEKVARAFPPVTAEEQEVIARFCSDIAQLHGDPVYYGQAHRKVK